MATKRRNLKQFNALTFLLTLFKSNKTQSLYYVKHNMSTHRGNAIDDNALYTEYRADRDVNMRLM